MNRRTYGWMIGLLLLFLQAAATERYCFRVYLKDKGSEQVDRISPARYLSEEALERRKRQRIAIDRSDLPVASAYLDRLRHAGGEPVVQSRWFNTVVVASGDSLLAERLQRLPMVDSVRLVWKGLPEETPAAPAAGDRLLPAEEPLGSLYGYAEKQIRMLDGEKLHRSGFRGEGMRVAVIDAGFHNVDRIAAFDSLQLRGTYNVVAPGKSVFTGDDHGTKVLSCLAANLPGIYVGTAPEADYWLIRSEDSRSEYPIEEDYWTAAVEYADSIGAEVVSSSLGYFRYDLPDTLYTNRDLDGQTSLISRAACRAVDKGLLLFCSAGNEGAASWKKITVPADAAGVATVGAVTDKKEKSHFSSVGPTADGRVKPDFVALGTSCCVIDAEGQVSYASGTSFATPTLAGLGVCLWQALPRLDNRSIIRLLQQAGSRAKRPDSELGYGIPDVYKAYKRGRKEEKHATR